MMNVRQRLDETLRQLDNAATLERHQVTAALEELAKAAKDAGESVEELRFELIASYLMLYEEPRDWGTHFGPEMSRVAASGERIDSPPLASLTPECLAYWKVRMAAASHPALKARYGDLVWDFNHKVTGVRPPITAAQIAIDGYVEAIVAGRCEPYDGSGDIQKRASQLAASVDAARLQTAIIRLRQYAAGAADPEEREYRQRELFGLLTEIRGARRPTAELQALAADLRSRLEELHASQADQFTIQNLALPLADYYRSTQQRVEAEAVLRMYGAAVERMAAAAMQAMLSAGWLTQLYEIYQRFEMPEEARQLLPKIEADSAGIDQELMRISHSTTIPPEEYDKLVGDVLGGTKADVLFKLAANFLPRIEETKQLVKNVAAQTFFMNVVTQQVVTEDGRVAASIGPVAEDLDGHVVWQLGQTMQLLGQLYRPMLEQAVAAHQLSGADCISWLRDCPLFVAERIPLLERAFTAYFEQDWATAIHLAVPQIEHALRQVLVLCGQTLLRPHRNGTFLLKNLDEVLRDPVADRALPEDVRVYLRTLLCDQRGLNMRNNVCHGLWGPDYFNWFVADRVMHAVLVIGLLRPAPLPAAPPADNAG